MRRTKPKVINKTVVDNLVIHALTVPQNRLIHALTVPALRINCPDPIYNLYSPVIK